MTKLARFHCGALETFSGPAIGTFSDIINLPLKARDAALTGKAPPTGGDLLNIILQNTPYANLAYTRPALDTLIIHALHNTSWAKSLERQYQRRKREYGQEHYDLYKALTGRY